MEMRAYSSVIWAALAMLALLLRAPNPYAKDFLGLVLPSLVLLASLQWLPLKAKLGWQMASLCAAVSAGIMIELLRLANQNENRLMWILPTALAGQLLILMVICPDAPTRWMVLVQTLAIGIVISLGTYFTFLRSEHKFPRTGLYLFWAPLGVMALWVNGMAYGWRKSTQVFFICLIAYNGVGFLDTAYAFRAGWMYGCALISFLVAFCFLIGWANDLNK